MKLYHLFAGTIIAGCMTLLTAPAFALNSEAYINALEETKTSVSQNTVDEEFSEEDIDFAWRVLQAGLQTYHAHDYSNQLTENDKKIADILDGEFASILNKIENSIDEVEEELYDAAERLAKALVENQDLYSQKPNMEIVTYLSMQTALTYCLMSGQVDEDIVELLLTEALELLQ